ncbi:hypothetical protein ACH5RR_017834 [Cinchona calisaya]|uniref:DUF4283 domain-containing protein n=1 Tax=Cinchona calisaya TaxID=153742 RepID=A0ABD2ZMY4_9GENT
MKILVDVDVFQSLLTGYKIRLEGTIRWFNFKYEKRPDFVKSGMDELGECFSANHEPSEGQASWVNIVKQQGCLHEGMGLEFVPPLAISGEVVIDMADVEDTLQNWKSAAIGFVMGVAPSFHSMKRYAETKWKEFGIVECTLLKYGVFIFNFESEDMKNQVLEKSLWPFLSKMLFLKSWTPDIDLSKEELISVPVWIKLPNLKLHYYNGRSLSKLESCIGTPLYSDKLTADQSRLSFARVCVEIGVHSVLPDKIPYVNEKGFKVSQEVIYEWIPSKCNHWVKFGHPTYSCPVQPRIEKKWVQKTTKEKEKGVVEDVAMVMDNQQESQFQSAKERGEPSTLAVNQVVVQDFVSPNQAQNTAEYGQQLPGDGTVASKVQILASNNTFEVLADEEGDSSKKKVNLVVDLRNLIENKTIKQKEIMQTEIASHLKNLRGRSTKKKGLGRGKSFDYLYL